MEILEQRLSAPPNEYKSLPFWSWNDDLDEEELRWQIRQMKDAGIGGFFMHARGGLRTPYMGDAWMQCVQACLDEAEQLGMEAWLYDEEGWPSGFAGGEVTALGDKYHTRWMELDTLPGNQVVWDDALLGAYTLDGRRLSQEKACATDAKPCHIVRQVSNPYYIDVLNHEVVRAFIQKTHEVYKARFPGMLGRQICGFFTDEPQYAKMQVPFSYCLPDRFEQDHGVSFYDHLPALFLDLPGCGAFRYKFWKTVSGMFTEAFCKTIYEWCEENHCQLTGHLMREDSLLMQMQATAGVMPSYEYLHMPGIDWLRRRISSPLTPKQVGSAAAQLGKKFVLSEMFALVGWDCTPQELRWIAHWQYVNGVNRMCQHLDAYSLRGIRKRDFPASQFYQQPWWEETRAFNDYFTRLGFLLTEGENETDALLLHPMRSAWTLYDGRDEGPIVEFGQRFEALSQQLADHHIDHHYGDEEILARHGGIQAGRFTVGKHAYRAVLIPDMLTIESRALELLLNFAKAGGPIFALGQLPRHTAGGGEELLEKLQQVAQPVSLPELKKEMNGLQAFPISVLENGRPAANLHYRLQKTEKGRVLFLTDLNKEGCRSVVVELPGAQQVTEYDPLADHYDSNPGVWQEGGHTRVALRFEAMDGKVLLIRPTAGTNPVPPQKPDEGKTVWLECGGRWDITRASPNAMLLDTCEYRIDGGEWQPKTNTIQLLDILLQRRVRAQVELRFAFTIRPDPSAFETLWLVAEAADTLSVSVNGQARQLQEEGWWLDKSFRKFDIRPLLVQGENELVLKIDFWQREKVYEVLFGENVLETEKNRLTYDTEIENIYLLGDFGVFSDNGFAYAWRREVLTRPGFTLDTLPKTLYSDDFTSQGFCFFSGQMQLRQTLFLHDFDDSRDVKIQPVDGYRYLYRFPRLHAAVAVLKVNGQTVKTYYWGAHEADITDYLHPGENELEWILYSSNRNLLGPHHHMDGELYAVWPADFTGEPSPFKADTRNVWSDNYHLVKFGF